MGFWKSKGKKQATAETAAAGAGEAVQGQNVLTLARTGCVEDHAAADTLANKGAEASDSEEAASSAACHRTRRTAHEQQTSAGSSRSIGVAAAEWQPRSETSLHELRDQRQPVSAISMESDISTEYDLPAFSIGGLSECFDWNMASDKGSIAVAVPGSHQSLPHSFSASHLEAFADAVNASRGRPSQGSSTGRRGSQTVVPNVPPRRSSLDASAFMLTNKHNSFPRHQLKRPPSVTPHQVSDEVVETLMQTPEHRCVRQEDTPAIAVRRDPQEFGQEPEPAKKGNKQILRRMIPSRRSGRQQESPVASGTKKSKSTAPSKDQETSIDGDLPSPAKKPPLPTKPRIAERSEVPINLLPLRVAAEKQATSRRRSESITSVDTVGHESRLSIASHHSSESSQSSPSCKKVIFGAYQQKPRRESSSLSRKEAKLASLRVLTLSRAYKAADSDDADALRSLLEDSSPGHEVSVLDRNENSATMLHVAARNGHVNCVDVLLAASSSPHDATTLVDNDGHTPAMLAIEHGHLDCLKKLVAAGNGDMDTDECGNTLIHHACYHGRSGCLLFLLKYIKEHKKEMGDCSNDKGVTPAHVAGQHGHIECLRVLVENKVDVLQHDEDDLTPLDWAKKDSQTLCHHYLTTIESCWSMSEQLESSQEQLDRSVHENASLRVQLAEAKQGRDAALEEVQKMTQESNEKVSQVRQEFITMIASIFQQLKASPNTQPTLKDYHPAVSRLSASQDATKWKSVSLPRHSANSRDVTLPTSLAHFKSLYEFKDESDDSSDNESDEENLPIFMHSSSSNSSASSSARVQSIMAKARARITRSVSSDISTDQSSSDWGASVKSPSPQHRQTAV